MGHKDPHSRARWRPNWKLRVAVPVTTCRGEYCGGRTTGRTDFLVFFCRI